MFAQNLLLLSFDALKDDEINIMNDIIKFLYRGDVCEAESLLKNLKTPQSLESFIKLHSYYIVPGILSVGKYPNLKTLKFLVNKYGAEILDNSALHLAVRSNYDVFEFIISDHDEFTVKNPEYCQSLPPMYYAVENLEDLVMEGHTGHCEQSRQQSKIIHLLLTKGADFNFTMPYRIKESVWSILENQVEEVLLQKKRGEKAKFTKKLGFFIIQGALITIPIIFLARSSYFFLSDPVKVILYVASFVCALSVPLCFLELYRYSKSCQNLEEQGSLLKEQINRLSGNSPPLYGDICGNPPSYQEACALLAEANSMPYGEIWEIRPPIQEACKLRT